MKRIFILLCLTAILFSVTAGCGAEGGRGSDTPQFSEPRSEQAADKATGTEPQPEQAADKATGTEPQPEQAADKATGTEPQPEQAADKESESAVWQDTEPEIQPGLQETEEDTMFQIEIIVGDNTFPATLYDNEAAKALKEMLPMTLGMSELNGNEKYYYLSDSLPADSVRPSGIQAGDLMLYGDSCVVLFYKSFSTSYSYTPLGSIDDPKGLAEALGSGSVQVTFQQ